NYVAEGMFERALAVAHVLKFARQRLPDLAQRPLPGPMLVVETLGAEGLRYSDRRAGGSDWRHLGAFPVKGVRDAAGCGDWCTAGLIHGLASRGRAGLEAAPSKEVEEALTFGQALGAWNCHFEGARGGVYRQSRAEFEEGVRALLGGREVAVPGAEG